MTRAKLVFYVFFYNNEATQHHQEKGPSQNVASPTGRLGLCHQQAAIGVGLAVPKPTGVPCMLSKPPW